MDWDWTLFFRGASAVGTFAAVLVALFKEDIVSYWRAPVLKVDFRLGPPDCHKTEVQFQPSGSKAESYYLRLRVKNDGKTRADMVQVYVSKLEREDANGDWKLVEGFLPMNLHWSINREVFAEGISPGMERHCDIGFIVDPANRPQKPNWSPPGVAGTVLSLDLEVQPFTQSHLLTPGKYRVHVKVAAANAGPVPATLELNLTGKWEADERTMFEKGVGLKLVG